MTTDPQTDPETGRLHDKILGLEAELAKMRDLLRTENQRANAAIEREETAEQAALEAEQERDQLRAAAVSPLPDQTLRDRIASAMARADGWEWAAANFASLTTPTVDRYRRCAEAVLAVLPPPVDRSAVLRDAEQHLRILADGASRGVWLGMRAAADELRRLAAEAQQECPGVETVPNRCTCDCEGCKHHCGAHKPAEAPQPELPCCSDPTCTCVQVNADGRCECTKWDAEAQQQDTEGPVPCSWVAVRSSHSPHAWEPQPGMTSVRCPGYRLPPMDPVHILGVDADRPAVPTQPAADDISKEAQS